MPELPEVEVARHNLARWAVGRTIDSAVADQAALRVLRPATARSLAQLVGARVLAVERTGKALLWTLAPRRGSAGARLGVYAHLGMTGKWLRRAPGDPVRFARLRLTLDDERLLVYADPRLLGRFLVVGGADFARLPEVARLGPDPLRDGVDADRLGAGLLRTRRAVKVALLDQSLLAGLGNIQANEALARAGIDPRRPASTLTAAEVRRLASAILATLEATLADFSAHGFLDDRADITYLEEGADNPFLVYGRAGERCRRCRRAEVVRVTLGGRGTFRCPRCQR